MSNELTYECPKCFGLGVMDKQILEVCDFCCGRKNNLNWIEHIFGVEPKQINFRNIYGELTIRHFNKETGKPVMRLNVTKNRYKNE